MTQEERDDVIGAISSLEKQLTGEMFEDMRIKDTIHNLQMKLNGTKPTDSHFDCIGCGSQKQINYIKKGKMSAAYWADKVKW